MTVDAVLNIKQPNNVPPVAQARVRAWCRRLFLKHEKTSSPPPTASRAGAFISKSPGPSWTPCARARRWQVRSCRFAGEKAAQTLLRLSVLAANSSVVESNEITQYSGLCVSGISSRPAISIGALAAVKLHLVSGAQFKKLSLTLFIDSTIVRQKLTVESCEPATSTSQLAGGP